MASQRLPKAAPSNTIVLNEHVEVKPKNEGKWLSIALGVISSLILVLLIAFAAFVLVMPEDRMSPPISASEYKLETETEWNTEHTEKF